MDKASEGNSKLINTRIAAKTLLVSNEAIMMKKEKIP